VLQSKNLAIGKIRTSFGVKGHVKILNFSGESSHFLKLDIISLEKGQLREKRKIENISVHGADIIIKFEGIDTPEDARKYIDWEIWVPREKASKLKKGEYYIADLIGCTLVPPKKAAEAAAVPAPAVPAVYGKIISILDGAGINDLLEVESPDPDEKNGKKVFLIPFRSEFIGQVDIEAGTVELTAEWIIP